MEKISEGAEKMMKIDPEMDMTKDMELIKGSKGIFYWFTTLKDIPKELFGKYVKGKRFLDIGCGDGRMITMAMMYGAKKYAGVELDEKFIKSSPMRRYIKKGDFRDIDFSNYDVLYYFLGGVENIPLDHKGEPELIECLKKFEGALIVYYRKVSHRLQKFHDNLIKEGFKEIDNLRYFRVYRRSTN